MSWWDSVSGVRFAREEKLRSELLQLGQELDLAQARHHELRRLFIRWGIASDGTVTLSEAELLHTEARRRFGRTLKCFSDLVFDR